MGKEEMYFAIITTIVGSLGIVFTWLQFRLARKKRRDDLFNLRYEFYKSVSGVWVSTYNKENSTLDITDLIPIAEKASFLFGEEISDHILNFENKRATNPLFPDDDFSRPFRKYLRLT